MKGGPSEHLSDALRCVRIGDTHGLHPRRRRPPAQPQERQPRAAARQARGHHRPVGVGQVEPRVRHALRRGAAPLRREPVRVRPPVPRADGQAGRGPHRGALAGHRHRAAQPLPQPALDRRHGHGDLRLPPPPLCPRGPAALPQLRQPHQEAVRPGHRQRGAARPRRAVGGALRPPHPEPPGPLRRPLQAPAATRPSWTATRSTPSSSSSTSSR
jgi:hypothetical protein